MMKNNKFLILLILYLFVFLNFNVESQRNSNCKLDFNELLFQVKVRRYMKIMDAPSVVACVIENNSIIHSYSFGYQNIYQLKKATLDSIYVIGSNSKVVTSTAILQLFEKGLIGLDNNINDYLPFEIVNPKHPDINITLRMLLSHQSSLGDNLGDIKYYYKYINNCSKWIKERLTVDGELFREQYWKDYEPGQKNHYSNIGFIIVSYLVEIISGQKFEDYCQEHIFIPLEMYNTSFQKEKLNSDMLARPYYPLFSRIFIPLVNYDIGCIAPCGGLRTNVKDLSHFLIAHMEDGAWNNVQILKEHTVKEMHRIQYPDESMDFYGGVLQHGLGWVHFNIYDSEWEGYYGGAVGYDCNMIIRKSDRTAIILLANGHFLRPKGPISNKISFFRFKTCFNLNVLLIQNALKNQ